MGLFSKLFGKKSEKEQEQVKVMYAPNDQEMQEATMRARDTFGYFWRELYWEKRRVIGALNIAMVKMKFEQNGNVEYMWINEIHFDGDKIQGTLVNSPGKLSNIKVGDRITKDLDALSDWMFVINGKSYGAFTIQSIRSKLSGSDLKSHDDQWRLNFGDHDNILIAYEQEENPDHLIEHPMCTSMAPKVKEFYESYPEEVTHIDENGYTLLHEEAIAGNKSNIKLLLQFGADKSLQSHSGKTAYDYAHEMKWNHILDILK